MSEDSKSVKEFMKTLRNQIFTIIIVGAFTAMTGNLIFIYSINDTIESMRMKQGELKEEIKELKTEILNIYKNE